MSWNEVLFARLPGFLPEVGVPPWFDRTMRPHRTTVGERWMLRNEVDEGTLSKGAWNLMLASSLLSVSVLAMAVLALGVGILIYGIIPTLLVPIIASSLYLNTPNTMGQGEERRMLGEAPAIIGCMTMSMQVSPSLERGVTFASERGDGALPARLREAMWSNLARNSGSLSEAIDDLCSSLSESNSSLKQSLHLVISATCERTKQGMDRLLDKANTVALGGVRDAVDSYAASLSMPTMVLFSLGTLLPIMLFSILPLLSLGTSMGAATGEQAIPLPYLAFLLLFIIPVSAMSYAWTILTRNPLGLVRRDAEDIRSLFSLPLVALWGAAVLAASLTDLGELRPYAIAGAAILTPCAFLGWKLRDHISSRRRRKQLEKEATSALFQIGNRMVSGTTFERALHDAATGQDGTPFQVFARSLLYRSRLYGRPLDEMIVEEGSLRAASRVVENAYVTVAQCAARDPRYAGQIALNLAHMLSDLGSCQGKIEEKLQGVVEMMRTTSMVFAPIVLGVTGALFALIGSQTSVGEGMADDVALITGIYIGELSLLVSFFTVLVMGDRSWRGIVHAYATRTPVAFVVFAAVSFICRTGLNSLM
ncbi:MAG: hypothetical protein SA339_10535 [Methanomassiliicoccus sp.]|nr:hypothetical protein [Methanomassiliicoccus sp.]